MAHAGVCEEFRAVARGVGEIGQRDGDLGADIAASAAVAAARAGGLGDARAIDHRIEGDGDGGRDGRAAEPASGGRERFELRVRGRARIALRAEPALRTAEPFLEQAILRNLARPDLVREHAIVGPQRYARVDQRAAAEPATYEHVHILAEAHVVKRARRAGLHAFARHLQLVLEVGEAAGETACQHLTAALEHGDALAGAGEPRGGNAAAVAGADDDDVVAVLDPVERAGEAGHARSLASNPGGESGAKVRRRRTGVKWVQCEAD